MGCGEDIPPVYKGATTSVSDQAIWVRISQKCHEREFPHRGIFTLKDDTFSRMCCWPCLMKCCQESVIGSQESVIGIGNKATAHSQEFVVAKADSLMAIFYERPQEVSLATIYNDFFLALYTPAMKNASRAWPHSPDCCPSRIALGFHVPRSCSKFQIDSLMLRLKKIQ